MRCKGSVFISPGKDLRTFCTRLWVLWARRHPFAGLHQRQQHESNPLFRHLHDICHPQPQSIGSHQPEAAAQLPRSRPGHHARETGPPKGHCAQSSATSRTDGHRQPHGGRPAPPGGRTCAAKGAKECSRTGGPVPARPPPCPGEGRMAKPQLFSPPAASHSRKNAFLCSKKPQPRQPSMPTTAYETPTEEPWPADDHRRCRPADCLWTHGEHGRQQSPGSGFCHHCNGTRGLHHTEQKD